MNVYSNPTIKSESCDNFFYLEENIDNIMNRYNEYKNVLVSKLVELYHLSKEEAIEFVELSSVNKMLKVESLAD